MKDYYFEIFSNMRQNPYSHWSYQGFKVIRAKSGEEAEKIARQITFEMSQTSEWLDYQPRNLRTL